MQLYSYRVLRIIIDKALNHGKDFHDAHLPPSNGQEERDDGSYWHRQCLAAREQLKVAQEEICHLQREKQEAATTDPE